MYKSDNIYAFNQIVGRYMPTNNYNVIKYYFGENIMNNYQLPNYYTVVGIIQKVVIKHRIPLINI